MKKIVITGGTGLIGRALIKELLADGHEITILSRSPGKYKAQFPASVHFLAWDAENVAGWAGAVDGADVVINLAAESIGGDNFLPDRWTDAKKERILQSRLHTSAAIVKAIEMAQNKPDLLLQASAIGYYGPREDEWVTEETPAGQDFLASVASAWEHATDGVKELGVRQILLRTGLIQTTKGGPLQRMILPFKFFVGGKYGSGQQWYSWIHLDDLIQAIIFLINNENASGPVNLVAPHPVRNKEFAKTLGNVMNRPSLIPVPAFAMRILAGEAAMLVLEGQRVSSVYLQELGFQFRFPQLKAALQDLINNDK
jgi:uncharacterized protein (TIGR01777 family)